MAVKAPAPTYVAPFSDAGSAALPFAEPGAPQAGLSLQSVSDMFAGATGPLPQPVTGVARQTGAAIAYSPSQNKFYAPGIGEFSADDEASMVKSMQSVGAGLRAPLPVGDWQALDPSSYAQKVG